MVWLLCGEWRRGEGRGVEWSGLDTGRRQTNTRTNTDTHSHRKIKTNKGVEKGKRDFGTHTNEVDNYLYIGGIGIQNYSIYQDIEAFKVAVKIGSRPVVPQSLKQGNVLN